MICGSVEWRMMPVASVTVNEPTPASPARADVSSGSHSPSGAAAPPMRPLWSTSWRSDASPAANEPRRYSETMNDRLPARDSAAASVWLRHHHRSTTRRAAKVSSAAVVSVAMASLDTDTFAEPPASVVISECPIAAHVAAAGDRLEDVARRHLAAVHVQRDRRRVE